MPKGLGSLIMRGFLRVIWRLSASRDLQGIESAVFVEDYAPCFTRIDQALELIARYDPDTLQHMRKLFKGILVFGNERFRAASWNTSADLCILTEWYVQSSSFRPVDLALTLIHESMHARLSKAGVDYREGRRAAIEVLCAMAELRFAKRVITDPNLRESAERRIDEWAKQGEGQWSDQTMRDAKLGYLRELGTPKWIVSIVGRLGQLINRRAA
jgi:hypothetical protein